MTWCLMRTMPENSLPKIGRLRMGWKTIRHAARKPAPPAKSWSFSARTESATEARKRVRRCIQPRSNCSRLSAQKASEVTSTAEISASLAARPGSEESAKGRFIRWRMILCLKMNSSQ